MNIIHIDEITLNPELKETIFRKSIQNGCYMNKCLDCSDTYYLIDKDDNFNIVIIHEFQSHLELYFIKQSSKNILLKKQLVTIRKKFPNKKIIVGLNLISNNFKILLNNLIKNGFCCPSISDNKSGKITCMYLTESKNSDKEFTLSEANRILKEYRCSKDNFIFREDDIEHIKSYLSENVEYAGKFKHQKFKDDIVLTLDKSTIVSGSDTSQTVNLEAYPFSFHTHPTIFYSYPGNNTFSGWFSALDIKYILNNSLRGVKTHFLFTQEGMYSLTVCPDFIEYMKSANKNERMKEVNKIITKFIELEGDRAAPTQDDVSKINKRTINQFIKFFQCVNGMKDVNGNPIFILDFVFDDELDNYKF